MDDEKPDEQADEKPVRRRRAKAEPEICSECWPDGWPSEDANSAGCPHGNWTR